MKLVHELRKLIEGETVLPKMKADVEKLLKKNLRSRDGLMYTPTKDKMDLKSALALFKSVDKLLKKYAHNQKGEKNPVHVSTSPTVNSKQRILYSVFSQSSYNTGKTLAEVGVRFVLDQQAKVLDSVEFTYKAKAEKVKKPIKKSAALKIIQKKYPKKKFEFSDYDANDYALFVEHPDSPNYDADVEYWVEPDGTVVRE